MNIPVNNQEIRKLEPVVIEQIVERERYVDPEKLIKVLDTTGSVIGIALEKFIIK